MQHLAIVESKTKEKESHCEEISDRSRLNVHAVWAFELFRKVFWTWSVARECYLLRGITDSKWRVVSFHQTKHNCYVWTKELDLPQIGRCLYFH